MSEPNQTIKKNRDHNISLAPTDSEWIDTVNSQFNKEEQAFADLVKTFHYLNEITNGKIEKRQEP